MAGWGHSAVQAAGGLGTRRSSVDAGPSWSGGHHVAIAQDQAESARASATGRLFPLGFIGQDGVSSIARCLQRHGFVRWTAPSFGQRAL